MRIVIAEDEQMFREVLRKLCAEEFGHEVVGEAEDGEEAIRVAVGQQPHLLLLDLDLPKQDGFAVAERVRQLSRSTLIIAVTSSRASYTLFRIEHGGFDGYVDKGANSLGSLRDALAAVSNGRRYHSAAFVAGKEARLRDPKAFDKVLSNREREVLCLIGLSWSDHEIGQHLGICARTVETFRHRILQKLGVAGTPKLIRYALEQGFTQLSALQSPPAIALRTPAPGSRVRR